MKENKEKLRNRKKEKKKNLFKGKEREREKLAETKRKKPLLSRENKCIRQSPPRGRSDDQHGTYTRW